MGDFDITDEIYRLAKSDPDASLNIFSNMAKSNRNVLMDPMLRLCWGIAYSTKGIKEFQSKGEHDNAIYDLYESALTEFRNFYRLSPEEVDIKPDLIKRLDSMGIYLEPARPGSFQEHFGKTKLKFLSYGGRVGINTDCAEIEQPTEDDQRLFGEIFFDFPFIIRYALILCCAASDDGLRYMAVGLFENTEDSDAKGDIELYDDGTYKPTVY